MRVPLILFCLSLLAVGGMSLMPDGLASPWVLLACLSAVASAILLGHATLQRRVSPPEPAPPPGPVLPRILVDGSNVMFWEAEEPRLATVIAVVRALEAEGFRPGVIFDASVGYRIGDRYQDDAELAMRLGLEAEDVLVVPKGTVADEYLLGAARDMKVRIVTNDKYRDWAEKFPEVRRKGKLVPGVVTKGKVRLEL